MKKIQIFTILSGLFLLVSACGPGTSVTPTVDVAPIYTSAAQTVEARFTQTAQAGTPIPTETLTPLPVTPTLTAQPLPTIPQTSGGGNVEPCLSANMISETIPDGTVFVPGQTFTKTWRIKNSGTCPWTSQYSLTLWSGDAMGAKQSTTLPAAVPGQIIELVVPMVAPLYEGSYRGNWRLGTPWGGSFGVGMYDSDLWVDIIVSTTPSFAVTSIDYSVARDPKSGCPPNIYYTITATITVNGPVTVDYHWVWSAVTDPIDRPVGSLVFTEAGSKSISKVWRLWPTSPQHSRWMAIYIDLPNNKQFDNPRADFEHICP